MIMFGGSFRHMLSINLQPSFCFVFLLRRGGKAHGRNKKLYGGSQSSGTRPVEGFLDANREQKSGTEVVLFTDCFGRKVILADNRLPVIIIIGGSVKLENVNEQKLREFFPPEKSNFQA